MRAARARAASRRGCVCAINASRPRPSSRQYCGNCVLFPEPVSPATINTWFRRSASMTASRRSVIGKPGSCLKTNGADARAAASRGFAAARCSLATLDFLPELLLGLEVQLLENLAALRRERFHAAEAPLELGVRGTQCRLRIDIEFAGQISGREQQIGDLLEDSRRRTRRRAGTFGGGTPLGRVAYFGEFLRDLVRGLAGVLEIEAHPRGPFAELEGAHQCRQRPRHPVQMTGSSAGGAALPRLDLFPGDALLGGSHPAAGAEHVRVPAQQLVAYRTGHRLEIEMLRLARDLRMKHHLKQQITELVLEVEHVAAFDGVGDFVSLFDGVRRNAREGLFPVPGAAIRGAQTRHDLEQLAHPAIGVEFRAHRGGSSRACSMRRSVISIPAVAPQILRSP